MVLLEGLKEVHTQVKKASARKEVIWRGNKVYLPPLNALFQVCYIVCTEKPGGVPVCECADVREDVPERSPCRC